MKDVVDVTKGLFALSRDTVQLESDAFVQRQRTALATELKQVLDSWVRFEQQQKESEQAELTKAVISKVMASLQDDKTKREILLGAVAEVERACFFDGRSLVLTCFLCAELVKNKAI